MGVAGDSMNGSMVKVTPRRCAAAWHSVTMSCTMAWRTASSGERASRVKSTRAGMTLIAPGCTCATPTVATVSVRVEPARSTMPIISATAASASRRMVIGTVPAWPASPITVARARVMPLMAETIPTGRSFASSERSLLDMHLEIAAIARRVAGERRRTVRIAAEADQRIAQARCHPDPGRRARPD